MSLSIKSSIIFLMALLVLSEACSLQENALGGTYLSTLEPASTPIGQISTIPENKYLFVEYWIEYDGESTLKWCDGAVMVDFPWYTYYSDTLTLPDTLIDLESDMKEIRGFFGDGFGHSGAMGGGESSLIHFIKDFPYESPPYPRNQLPDKRVVIHTVEADGTIIVEIRVEGMEGGTFSMKPGQSWIYETRDTPSLHCRTITTYRFTNYGLIGRGQIEVGSFSLP